MLIGWWTLAYGSLPISSNVTYHHALSLFFWKVNFSFDKVQILHVFFYIWEKNIFCIPKLKTSVFQTLYNFYHCVFLSYIILSCGFHIFLVKYKIHYFSIKRYRCSDTFYSKRLFFFPWTTSLSPFWYLCHLETI